MKISIITASYNYAQYIKEAINSVLTQTYPDWELIIVDDGSSDNSVEIIKEFCQKDSRIKLFQHENGTNKGLKKTILLGLENATGDWIAFLESDDVFKPDNLLKKVEAIKNNPDVSLIFNTVEFFGNQQKVKKIKRNFFPTQKELLKMAFPKKMFHDFYLKNMIFTFSSVMVKKQTLKAVNFETQEDSLLDWWLWIHLAYKNDFYYIHEELTRWRIHEISYINKNKKSPFFQIRAYLNVYKEYKDLKILIFILFFIPFLFLFKIKKFLNKISNKILTGAC